MGQVWAYNTISADVRQNTLNQKYLSHLMKTWKSAFGEEEEGLSIFILQTLPLWQTGV